VVLEVDKIVGLDEPNELRIRGYCIPSQNDDAFCVDDQHRDQVPTLIYASEYLSASAPRIESVHPPRVWRRADVELRGGGSTTIDIIDMLPLTDDRSQSMVTVRFDRPIEDRANGELLTLLPGFVRPPIRTSLALPAPWDPFDTRFRSANYDNLVLYEGFAVVGEWTPIPELAGLFGAHEIDGSLNVGYAGTGGFVRAMSPVQLLETEPAGEVSGPDGATRPGTAVANVSEPVTAFWTDQESSASSSRSRVIGGLLIGVGCSVVATALMPSLYRSGRGPNGPTERPRSPRSLGEVVIAASLVTITLLLTRRTKDNRGRRR
jgi:hypothetical protein